MGASKHEQKEVTINYINRYGGQLSKKKISEKLYEDRPDLYTNAEQARVSVRYYCGQNGKARNGQRLHTDNNRLFFADHPEPQLTNVFRKIENDKARILVIGDVHVPFHDKKAVDAAFNYGLRSGTDIVILNGDLFDHYSESTHGKELGNRNPEHDYHEYQSFLFELRCAFPGARIIFKVGNHENRYFMWFVRAGMADMLQIHKFRYEEIMNFAEYGIDLVDEYATIEVAGLNIIHGHEYAGGGGINPARWLSLRTGESTMCGHFHRTSEHSQKVHRGDIQTWWSVGALCDLRPRYRPYNNWNHGFAFIVKDGEMYHVKNKRIYNGVIL